MRLAGLFAAPLPAPGVTRGRLKRHAHPATPPEPDVWPDMRNLAFLLIGEAPDRRLAIALSIEAGLVSVFAQHWPRHIARRLAAVITDAIEAVALELESHAGNA
jgi:hypothetical protein